MMSSQHNPLHGETDEQFARRLQAAELGMGRSDYRPVPLTAEGTPLMVS